MQCQMQFVQLTKIQNMMINNDGKIEMLNLMIKLLEEKDPSMISGMCVIADTMNSSLRYAFQEAWADYKMHCKIESIEMYDHRGNKGPMDDKSNWGNYAYGWPRGLKEPRIVWCKEKLIYYENS